MENNSIGTTQVPKQAVKLAQAFTVFISDTGEITINRQPISESEFIQLMGMLVNELVQYKALSKTHNVGAIVIDRLNNWNENMVKLSNSEKP